MSLNRRGWLGGLGAALGVSVGAGAPARVMAVPPASVDEVFGAATPDPRRIPGRLPSEVGSRSPHEQPQRLVTQRALSGWSHTPLEQLTGLLTPADLHFERHHAGIPALDPERYELLIHGDCAQPRRYTLADLKRFPATTRVLFLECSGNGFASGLPAAQIPENIRATELDGLMSTSEWTGVRLSTLLGEVGLKPRAEWLLAEGSDAARMTRSVPLAKALDDALVVYAQNGEALRPEQGYPVRLLLPGWEGNMSIKWLTRIEIGPMPFMTREETSKYSDAMSDGGTRLFSFTMDPKSLILSPSYPQQVPEPGWWEIRGLAWSGYGAVRRVEVSIDGGRRWRPASFDGPAQPKAPVHFRFPWRWDGKPTQLLSRCIDDSGRRQPDAKTQRVGRGPATVYHNNAIRPWSVGADGKITFGLGEWLS